MNSLLNSMTGNNQLNNMQNLINQYKSFRKTFSGDPRQKIQEMLSSGQITQQQVDQARSLASQFQNLLK